MPRTAGPDETAPTEADLCRILHPSSGLPGRVVRSIVGDLGTGDESGRGQGDAHLADVVPIDGHPRLAAARPTRRRPGR